MLVANSLSAFIRSKTVRVRANCQHAEGISFCFVKVEATLFASLIDWREYHADNLFMSARGALLIANVKPGPQQQVSIVSLLG